MAFFLKDYTLQEAIHSSAFTTIYRGIKNDNKSPVIIKIVKSEFIQDSYAQKFKNEFLMLKMMDIPGVIKANDLVIDSKTIALVLEPFSAQTLSSYIKMETWDFETRLDIACQLADIIGEIHLKHIIHKDIKSQNVLINPKNQIKIIDFGIATQMAREMPQYFEPEGLEGTLSYISPEQTARMARVVDYRTDIYSLGIILYELFTGQLPFVAKTPMELIHMHIAQRPIPPSQVNPAIPEVVSNIILKCLEKDVPDRYKSAFGLKVDLEKCLSLYKDLGSIPSFTPGENDFYDRFHTPQTIFGREKELKIVHDCINNAWDGTLQVLEVSGYSGIGKSSVVMKFQAEIQRRGGRFAHANFDQFKRSIPYQAISQVIKTLIHQILMESEEKLLLWKERILEAVGSNGQIVIDLVPDLRMIIGEQPLIEPIPPQEAEARFKHVMTKFLTILPRYDRPLVILFDDFQWCDEPSLKLLTHVITNSSISSLLLIISYRENEVTPFHPLTHSLKEIAESGIPMTSLQLAPLPASYVEQIIFEIFSKLPSEDSKPLSQIVEQKTHGNPFFVIQFLKYLYDKELIQFDKKTLSWRANISAINALGVSDNVVDLLVEKIKTCDPDLQRMIKGCAIIGNRFDLALVSDFLGENPKTVLKYLTDAYQEEFLHPDFLALSGRSEVIYSFSHDRILQAFYNMMSEDERIRLHYQLGKTYLRFYSSEEINENLIMIVNHLNFGLKLPIEDANKKELLDLNLHAALKVIDSQAYSSATIFLKNGISLLGSECWENQYETTLALYNNLAISFQFSGNLDEARHIFELCLEKAKTPEVKAKICIELVYLLTQTQEYNQIVVYACRAFEALKYPFNPEPSKMDILLLFIKTKIRLKLYTDEQLKNFPITKENRAQLIVSLIVALNGVAYKTGNRLLLVWIILLSLNCTLDFGITSSGPMAFLAYGLLLASEKIGDYEGSVRYGLIGFEIANRLPESAETGLARFTYANWIFRLKHPIRESIPLLWEAYRICKENGNIPISATALYIISLIDLLTGAPLEATLDRIQSSCKELSKLKTKSEEYSLFIFRTFCESLLGKTENPSDCCPPELSGDLADLEQTTEIRLEHLYYRTLRQLLLYLFDEYQQANYFAKKNLTLVEKFPWSQMWPITYTSAALSCAALMRKPSDNWHDWKLILDLYRQLKKWSKTAPMNYGPHALMMKGEIARLKGNEDEAVFCYQEAIRTAKDERNILLTAMAYELFARYYVLMKEDEFVIYFLTKALYYYTAMGAQSKANHVRMYYEPYFPPNVEEKAVEEMETTSETQMTTETQEITSITSSSSLHGSFDLNTIVEASQSLSKEINFDKLMESLMRLMVLNAGATKANLILFDGTKPVVSTEILMDQPFTPLSAPIPLKLREDRICVPIIEYVIRTKSDLVLNHVQSPTSAFYNEPYILKEKPKSVLCFPLLQSDELKGILYLENMQSEDAFTAKRRHLLSLLSSQIAISIENARFYSKLENMVEERTSELKDKNNQLQEALRHIQEVQEQLIQQEKLASLGLLTAGIAHELKNPLNFVINFSQIAKTHLEDLLSSLEKDNREEQLFLIDELVSNLDIIDSHGMRANNIIKGMLSHSHQGTKSIEKVNMNAIIDQALGLSFYTFRKKHPSFNMEVIKRYDEDLPIIDGYSGELMRVFINMIDNACYALAEKLEKEGGEFQPIFEIFTSQNSDNSIKITIRDNGPGIPKESIDKVFNPFYTSKPSGSGTGLGLSISYDIITKQHAGKITVHSEQGMMTEFTIILPIKLQPAVGGHDN